ncbi:hypothetical protein SAMN05444166_7978 [Singulisphaera sp. GP187]|uniref:hypothetical protein n=1 Tax=Singulisphaera sp. GP187 TaxID=1882752 RepID=UPI000927B42F|nr:hypothetical protein [Singulisphaera sp. GP187]SIO66150.1 hypothetical protein SAMN05444166_7978 [Singulisphaera sp. GP187]
MGVLGRFGCFALLFAEPHFIGDQLDKTVGVRPERGVVFEVIPHENRLATLPTTLLVVEQGHDQTAGRVRAQGQIVIERRPLSGRFAHGFVSYQVARSAFRELRKVMIVNPMR